MLCSHLCRCEHEGFPHPPREVADQINDQVNRGVDDNVVAPTEDPQVPHLLRQLSREPLSERAWKRTALEVFRTLSGQKAAGIPLAVCEPVLTAPSDFGAMARHVVAQTLGEENQRDDKKDEGRMSQDDSLL